MEKGLERKQCCLLGSCPNHFFHFPYATGAILIAALVLNPRVGGFAYILGPCGSFKWTLLRDQWFLPVPQSPLGLQPEVMRLYFLGTGTLGCAVYPGAGIAHSPDVPSNFYLPHVNVGLSVPLAAATAASFPLPHHCHSVSSPPWLPISAPPTHLDEYFFFKSLVVRFIYSLIFWQSLLFFVLKLVFIILMVVQGGKVCLPMPPSWPEVILWVCLLVYFKVKFLSCTLEILNASDTCIMYASSLNFHNIYLIIDHKKNFKNEKNTHIQRS